MNRPYVRALLASAAVAAAIALAGCNPDSIVPTGRSQAPISDKTLAEIEAKQMDKDSPILARIFKEEAEMEIWKKNRNGEFALLKTFPICRWSGDLGPKKKEGDRQAPEGFYTITPGQMNPASNYYLAFNTGFPNTYDRAWGYTGSELMVHGDCSSRGCYAMTDEQIQEIYALARESFFGGQNAFQLQAFPFRMTALNMAKHRNNLNFAFWKMLKEGYDNFEATKQEPKVAVCEKRYVFDAAPPENSSKPLRFDAKGACPVYQLDKNVAESVLEHRRQEQFKMAEHIAHNVAVVPDRRGIDGGMNPVFASKLATHNEFDNNGRAYQVAGNTQAPGALPRTPNPPAVAAETPQAATSQPVVMANVPMPTPAPRAKIGEAPPEQPTSIAGLLGNMFSSKSEPAPTQTAAASEPVSLRGSKTEVAVKTNRDSAARIAAAPAVLPKPREAAPKEVAANAPAPKPVESNAPAAAPAPRVVKQAEPARAPDGEIRTAFSAAPPPATTNGLLTGAAPVVPVGTFDSRFNGVR